MKDEEYSRLIQRMTEINKDDQAAVLVSLNGDDVKVSTFGEPRPLTALKGWMYKWLGGRDDLRGGVK